MPTNYIALYLCTCLYYKNNFPIFFNILIKLSVVRVISVLGKTMNIKYVSSYTWSSCFRGYLRNSFKICLCKLCQKD